MKQWVQQIISGQNLRKELAFLCLMAVIALFSYMMWERPVDYIHLTGTVQAVNRNCPENRACFWVITVMLEFGLRVDMPFSATEPPFVGKRISVIGQVFEDGKIVYLPDNI